MVFITWQPYTYGFWFLKSLRVWFLVFNRFTHTEFFHIQVFQIQYPYRYYTLTLPVRGTIFNDTRMVSENNHHIVWGPILVW